ncbi:MAG: hypothetical protein ACREBR_04900 [bacterium]
MPKHGIVTLTLSKAEAEWLYDLLAEKYDEGGSSEHDEQNAYYIGDRLDLAITDSTEK